ncbi:MAG TPA: tRNA (adenosine(37)-N6)-threonylcarbamoyltransferase complex ATPase subunit type 1 TsaE, partial [Xanthomarina gelatinilytica]|nr:tRNA (adenosine(37)-N6)-threonylcarbamoyltransferase complex ATPase subunit type 1 TsaE [Xanthomarina gelatinilytica]
MQKSNNLNVDYRIDELQTVANQLLK